MMTEKQAVLFDTEDKSHWCKVGSDYELEFIERFGKRVGARINPEKEHNPYVADLLLHGSLVGDLKTQTEPFWTADRYGFSPLSTVTLNGKDINRYKELYPDITVFFWVRFAGGVKYNRSVPQMEAVYSMTLSQIMRMIDENYSHRHYYQRRQDDHINAQYSYLFDTSMLLQWFPR